MWNPELSDFCPKERCVLGRLGFNADPATIFLVVGAVTGVGSAAMAYRGSVQADKAAREQKKVTKSREAELAAEAAAKEAANVKARSAGQRAGFGGGVPSFRNNLIGGTGFTAPATAKEDNIGHGTLFGN